MTIKKLFLNINKFDGITFKEIKNLKLVEVQS